MGKQEYKKTTLHHPICPGCNKVIIGLCKEGIKEGKGLFFHDVYCYKAWEEKQKKGED